VAGDVADSRRDDLPDARFGGGPAAARASSTPQRPPTGASRHARTRWSDAAAAVAGPWPCCTSCPALSRSNFFVLFSAPRRCGDRATSPYAAGEPVPRRVRPLRPRSGPPATERQLGHGRTRCLSPRQRTGVVARLGVAHRCTPSRPCRSRNLLVTGHATASLSAVDWNLSEGSLRGPPCPAFLSLVPPAAGCGRATARRSARAFCPPHRAQPTALKKKHNKQMRKQQKKRVK